MYTHQINLDPAPEFLRSFPLQAHSQEFDVAGSLAAYSAINLRRTDGRATAAGGLTYYRRATPLSAALGRTGGRMRWPQPQTPHGE